MIFILRCAKCGDMLKAKWDTFLQYIESVESEQVPVLLIEPCLKCKTELTLPGELIGKIDKYFTEKNQ